MRDLIIVLLIAQFQLAISQNKTSSFKFRVYLADKNINDFDRVNPNTYLSKKALDRRSQEGVDIDSTDYPLSISYKEIIDQLGVIIVAESKWFNTLVVQCADSLKIKELEAISFIDSVKYVWRGNPAKDDV